MGPEDRVIDLRVLGIFVAALLACSAGSAACLLFRHLAGRLLQGIACLLAIAIFAVAYPLVRYSAEAKPYGPTCSCRWCCWRCWSSGCGVPGRRAGGWALVVAMPLAVLLSYPAVFVAGGHQPGHGDRCC